MFKSIQHNATAPKRLQSLDFFRGITMFLLLGEFTHLYTLLISPKLQNTFISYTSTVLFHHQHWAGLHFWDLVQPFFMFIAGVTIPFAVANRYDKGDTYTQIKKHTIKRSFFLLLLGWMLYCIVAGTIKFNFQNILAQLSITYLIAFFIMKYSIKTQLSISFLLLIISELLYRNFPLHGFNQAFIADHNFGAWLDLLISGELSSGHWVSFNAIPTSAHTIWGVITGIILMGTRHSTDKIKILLSFAFLLIIVGYGLSYYTPIIKRIATTSFVFVTGGLTLIAFTFFYWIIDIVKFDKGTKPFIIVGMNSLFIYLFAHVGGAKLLLNIVKPFSLAIFGWLIPIYAQIISSLIVLFLLWYLCYWLYKNKIFIKI